MYGIEYVTIVLKAYNNRKSIGMTVNQIALFYEISKQTIYNWIKGMYNISDKNKRVYVRKIDNDDIKHKEYVIKYVNSNPQFNIKILLKNRPTIILESVLQLDSEFGYTKEELYDFFNSNNYAILIPNRLAHDDPGLSKEAFLEGHLYPRRTTNYFAIPRERRVEIRDRGRNILNIPIN
jgi:hypothetical protein